VPAFFIRSAGGRGETFFLSGAQPAEAFAGAFQRALKSAAA
jgi:hypothetical protein